MEIDLHFACEHVSLGEICVLHIPTSSQFADVFTKGLTTSVFDAFRASLNARAHPVSAAEGEGCVFEDTTQRTHRQPMGCPESGGDHAPLITSRPTSSVVAGLSPCVL